MFSRKALRIGIRKRTGRSPPALSYLVMMERVTPHMRAISALPPTISASFSMLVIIFDASG